MAASRDAQKGKEVFASLEQQFGSSALNIQGGIDITDKGSLESQKLWQGVSQVAIAVGPVFGRQPGGEMGYAALNSNCHYVRYRKKAKNGPHSKMRPDWHKAFYCQRTEERSSVQQIKEIAFFRLPLAYVQAHIHSKEMPLRLKRPQACSKLYFGVSNHFFEQLQRPGEKMCLSL